ncbi:hypothetical protein [uncultured Friedmanniella sp.]|uniref:hypothetical protein n=1 Tax=uncultured Friedmanniella sp. TaxID=335381 RepID=UPI0035CA0B90
MNGPRRSSLAVVAALALLTGCGGPADLMVDRPLDQPDVRTTWALRHRVVESDGLRITHRSISAFEESTGVSLGPGQDDSCYVSVSAPGQGGPDNKVGEKVATRFKGRPAVRDGAGAEGPYLMWRLGGDSWVEVSCLEPGPIDTVAAAVRLTHSSVTLPFGLDSLPEGYQLAQIEQDLGRGTTDLYVGRVELGLPDSDLQISLLGPEVLRAPAGRTVTIQGLPALLDDKPTSPRVCVPVQSHHICVGITPSDTGPYPDRSAEIPTLLAIAEQLSYAADLDDRSTWTPAEKFFG